MLLPNSCVTIGALYRGATPAATKKEIPPDRFFGELINSRLPKPIFTNLGQKPCRKKTPPTDHLAASLYRYPRAFMADLRARRRIVPPTKPKPEIIEAHVAGSGTGLTENWLYIVAVEVVP